ATSATSLTISRPSGTLANDVMVASITAHGSSATPTITNPLPAGWTLVLNTAINGQKLAVLTLWKIAGTAAADPGPYTFTVSSSSALSGGISAYFNVDTTAPINASAAAQTNSVSITTTGFNTMLVACFGRDDGTAIAAPSGMTERFHVESGATTSDAASESSDALQAAPGSTTKSSTAARISQLIALAPASSNCPPDTVKAAGTSCTADGNVCTADVCNGTVGAPACTHPAGNAGTVCRASAGVC